MKPHILCLILCVLIGPIYSQSTYHPLIESEKTWHVLEGDFGGFSTYTYMVEGDTMINQKNFKFLYRSNEEYPVNWTNFGYIREDENKKVYYSPYHGNDTILNEPAMVYNVGAELYDTLIITSFAYNYPTELEIVISGIDSVLIGNEYRRRMAFECESFMDNFWIEGIGSNNGLIEPGFYCYIVCPTVELLCVKEDDNIVYHNEYYESCFIVGVQETAIAKQKFLVYPNPAKKDIYITPQSNVGSEFVFVLCNLESEVIIQRKIINFNPSVINITNLKDGLYLYRIIDNDQLVQNGKIIIKK